MGFLLLIIRIQDHHHFSNSLEFGWNGATNRLCWIFFWANELLFRGFDNESLVLVDTFKRRRDIFSKWQGCEKRYDFYFSTVHGEKLGEKQLVSQDRCLTDLQDDLLGCFPQWQPLKAFTSPADVNGLSGFLFLGWGEGIPKFFSQFSQELSCSETSGKRRFSSLYAFSQ